MHRARSGLLLVCLAGLTAAAGHASDELNRELRRIFDSKDYEAKTVGPVRWIDNGAAYTTLESSPGRKEAKDIVQHETATGARKVLIPATALIPPGGGEPLKIDEYSWSTDAKRLLIFTNTKKVWRSNTRGDYWVLDRTTGKFQQLGRNAPASSLMFAKFSPDGESVAYVRANNLYVESMSNKSVRPITTDGSETVINVTSDWVYEEELSLRDCFRWSPDSQHIAYWQFDSSRVEKFTLVNNTDSLYPKTTLIPYPKVGTTNSAVRIGAVSATAGETRWMQVPGAARQNYLFRMDWLPDSRQLAIGQLNRLQNHLTVFLADAATGSTKPIFEDKDAAWVDVPKFGGKRDDKFEFADEEKQVLWLSERDGWRQAYLASVSNLTPRKVTTAD